MKRIAAALVLMALPLAGAKGQDVKVLNGFNDEAQCAAFKWGVKFDLTEEHVTEGKRAAKVTFPAGKEYAGFGIPKELLARWGDYDHFAFDVFNPNDADVGVMIRIDDDKST